MMQHGKKKKKTSYNTILLLAIPVIILLVLSWPLVLRVHDAMTSKDASAPRAAKPVSRLGSFKGDRWRTDLTVSTEVVYESPFAICEVHAVRSEDGSKVMEDWLWMEEINHVNVVVFEKKTQEFIFFRQGKYGLREDSLAVVGGLQEQGESGLETSRREVREELGMVSQNEFTAIQAGEEEAFDATSDENWVSFGQYRCAVNRGGGWVSVFLLLDAVAIDENGGTNDFGQVAQNSGTAFETTATGKAEADGEAQAVVRMNTQQARRALMQGEFKEIKWSAALAFALLHIEDNGL